MPRPVHDTSAAAAGRVLIIEDDPDASDLVARALEHSEHDVVTAATAGEAETVFGRDDFDAVIADVRLDSASGLELCRRFGSVKPQVPVIIMTGAADLDTAVEAIRSGAYDFLAKPVQLRELRLIVQRAVEHKQLRDEVKMLRDEVRRQPRVDSLVGASPGMRKVLELIHQVAPHDGTVLVSGESGTGKELVARAIHEKSARADKPFVAINCAAMPASLLESELFGHVKGAFTDAKQAREGLFVRADGGTLFLDEIGEMPLQMQAKLLRVLQERKVRPIGGTHEIAFDTRIISATNRDLEDDVENGRFREDLYFRVNIIGISVPPLRDRGSDILLLAQHFLDEVASRFDKQVTGLDPDAAQKLVDYDWPGNVRELRNCIERAVTLTRHELIQVADLPDAVREFQPDRLVIAGADPDELPTLEEMERRFIRRVLNAVGWNKSRAARILGMDRRTLYRKLDRHDIEEPS